MFIIVVLLPLFYVSCEKQTTVKPKKNDETHIVKKFVYETTKNYYLWEEHIPADIDMNKYKNPNKLFKDMYYPKLDRWSFLTDNSQRLNNDLQGKRKAAGFRFRVYSYENNESELYFLVEFVYPDGNAYKAGLRRGDIITKIDGQKLNKSNYRDLISKDQLNLSFGKMKDNKIVDIEKTMNVTKLEQSFSPIIKDTIINKNGKKIGYFLFDQFINKYDDDMLKVLQSFKNEGIKDLVLDLRYNSGGYVSTCAKLGSSLTAFSNFNKTFLTYQYNKKLTNLYKRQINSDEYLKVKFPITGVNLDLRNLYVLSSRRTASASEAIVNGLRPYMNVVLIGDTTSGKYTAVNVFSDSNKPPAHNWALFLVISRIANVDGVTDYMNGFVPDHLVEDNLTTPLGDESEPLFAKAIELITGSTAKSAVAELPENLKLHKIVYQNSFEEAGLMINDTWKKE